MPDTLDLDDRIRDLMARVVADAPSEHEVERRMERARTRRPRRRGLVPLIALGTAAAIVMALVLFNTPERGTTVNPIADDPTVAAGQAPLIVLAGHDGVVEWTPSNQRTITTESMAIAVAVSDGTFVAQRHTGCCGGDAWNDADTEPVHISADGKITKLFQGYDWGGPVTLHDFSIVDGKRLLMYSVETGIGNPDTSSNDLYVVDLDTQHRVHVAQIGRWESGTGRLHLGSNGLIVGTRYSEATHGIKILSVPGTFATTPTGRTVGLEDDYGECQTCPRGFSLSADGRTIYWLEPAAPLAEGAWTVVGQEWEDRTAGPIAGATIPHSAFNEIDVSTIGVTSSFAFNDTSPSATNAVLYENTGSQKQLPGPVATVGPFG